MGAVEWGGEPAMGMTLLSVSSMQVANHSFDEVGGGGVTAHVSRPHLEEDDGGSAHTHTRKGERTKTKWRMNTELKSNGGKAEMEMKIKNMQTLPKRCYLHISH